mgnify:CR=1 FL=1
MKKIVIMLMMASALFALDSSWLSDYDKAVKIAQKENKNIYVFVTSDYCKWCREFENVTLGNKQVIKKLEKEYVLVHFSKEKHQVPKEFKTSPIPRHYFVSPQKDVFFEDLGYRNEKYFLGVLNDISQGDDE